MDDHPIIGLTGKKRSGKDTFADFLVSEYGYVRMGFADALRESMEALNPIVHSSGTRYREVLEDFGYERGKDFFPEMRRLLQVMGTEVARNIFGDDVWVKILVRKIDALRGSAPVVITDVRFPNEWQAIVNSLYGYVVRIERPGQDESDPHPSETAVDHLQPYWTIQNTGTIDDLHLWASIIHHEVAKS